MWNRMIYKTVKSDLLMGPKCFVQAKRYSRSILARDQFRIKGRITLVQDLINNYFQHYYPSYFSRLYEFGARSSALFTESQIWSWLNFVANQCCSQSRRGTSSAAVENLCSSYQNGVCSSSLSLSLCSELATSISILHQDPLITDYL